METLNSLKEALKGLDAFDVINRIASEYGSDAAFATSLGLEDQVISHMCSRASGQPRIFTLDTGRIFPETYALIDRTREKLGVEIEVYFPDCRALETVLKEKGTNFFYNSVEDRKECCRIRKIEPLKRALASSRVWITGLRKEQSVTREGMELVEFDEALGVIKLNPLLEWSLEEVEAYIHEHNVPYNPLHDRGFVSIGCQPCTRAIEAGEDIRAGRWWWENPEHKECGLHIRK